LKIRDNSKFIAIFTSVILIFFWKMITMKDSFIAGDHLSQFYPWFKTYSEAIKHLSFPFWTRYIQSGFPLMAEGQIGGYYPFNIIFFLTLPFNVAYNYIIVFHFIVAGISAYLLTRKLGACELGGTIAAIIFCFGSAYAGCFYNIITLKTLSWTPLVLYLFELFFEKKRAVYVIAAGILFGMQLLAGFIQMAAYCWIFYAVYFLYKSRLLKQSLYLALFSSVGFLLFMPQLLLTYRLVAASARTMADLQFALWGSYNPAFIAQTVFPYWPGFLRNDLYFSVFGLLFLIASFYLLRTDKKLRAIFVIFALSFLMSLGKYDPLYVLAVKLFKLYSFRNPSKFLFFTAMAASVLIGRGFSEFMREDFKHKKSALKIYSIVLCLFGIIFIASKTALAVFKNAIINMGEKYAAKSIFGTSAHRYDMDTYIKKVHDMYLLFVDGASLNNIFNIISWLLLLSALVISLFLIKRMSARIPAFSKNLAVCAITLDLFIYSFIGKGFRSNIQDVGTLKPTHAYILNYLKGDRGMFRVLPYGVGSGELPSWIMPNTNILYCIDSVAGYTPLANEHYRKALLPLEIIDNSLGVKVPERNSIAENMDLLRLLNVKYIVSYEKLNESGLKFIVRDNGVYLYRLNNDLPRAFVLKNLDLKSVDSNIEVKMVEYVSGRAVLKVDMPYRGFLVFSENNYAGWRASVNGKPKELTPFSLVSAIELDRGGNLVEFVYDPYIGNVNYGK
jgi:hypothetical protein